MSILTDPRHEKAMQRMKNLATEARSMLRTVGPRISAADAIQDEVAIRHCPICTPPERTWTCPICDFETNTQWVFRMHLKFDPAWCRRRGEKKQRKWASKV